MKIVKYKVLLNEENKNVLVKENAQLYYCAGGVLNISWSCGLIHSETKRSLYKALFMRSC